jgi:hypothetical protein
MAIPQPKILSAITVPTGGWVFKLYVSRLAEYDTTVTATIAAGTYFLAWDNQSDDFLYAFANTVNAAIDAAHAAFPTDSITCWLDSSYKVNIGFEDTYYQGDPARGIKLAWTESDGDDIAKVLGFDYSADDTNASASGSNNKTFTADWQHGYGWYANDDGLLRDSLVEDEHEVEAMQSVAHSGLVRTQRIGQRFLNSIQLEFVPRSRMFSQNVGYGTASVYPYEYNQGLECWWILAQQGYRFRFYRDGRHTIASAAVSGTATASNTTTLTDGGRSFDTDPQPYKGRLLWVATYGANTASPARFYISSHTATVLTAANAHPYSQNLTAGGSTYYVFDQPYQTYVVDLAKMKTFKPAQTAEALDVYSIEIPVRRYVSS